MWQGRAQMQRRVASSLSAARLRTASAEDSSADAVVFVVRHGDRFDREVGGWDGGQRWWLEPPGDEPPSHATHHAAHGANAHDPPLSALGQRQAMELGRWLASREDVPPIDRLVVSPVARQQTSSLSRAAAAPQMGTSQIARVEIEVEDGEPCATARA